MKKCLVLVLALLAPGLASAQAILNGIDLLAGPNDTAVNLRNPGAKIQFGPGDYLRDVSGTLTPSAPFGLPQYATSSLPVTCAEGALAWDTTANAVKSCHSNIWSGVSGSGVLPTGGLAGQHLAGPTASPSWVWGNSCIASAAGEVNVVDCGADPTDGISSSAQSTAFTNAIATGAKRIIIPDGTYSLATGLTVPSDGSGQNVAGIEIVGLGQPHIILTSATNAIALDIAKQRYVRIANLWITSTGTATDGNNTIGVKFEADSSRMVFEHNRIEDFSAAGVQAIQPLIFSARDNIINANNDGWDFEENGASVPTTVMIIGGYVTGNLRGFYGNGLVGGKLDGVAFESNGSSTTTDAAIQLNTGSRGVGIHACYFEANNRNYVFTDSRTTRVGNVYVGTPAGADVITWSGVATANRVNTEITNDTIFGGHFAPDPNAGVDPDFIMSRTNPALTGTMKFAHSQTPSWRNQANTGDLALGVNSSDQLTFNGSVVGSGSGIPLSTVTTAGDLVVGTGSSTVSRLGIGSTGQVLTVSGGTPVWAAAASSGVSLQSTFPGVADSGNAHVSGSLKADGDLYGVSGFFSGTVGALQFTTPYSFFADRYLALNLETVPPAYVLHTLGQIRFQAMADPSAPIATPVGVGAPVTSGGGSSQTFTFASAGTITRSSGSWTSDDYIVGASAIVTGTVSNNTTYRITAVTSTQLTVTPAPVNETFSTAGATITGGFGQTSYTYYAVCHGPYSGSTNVSTAGTTSTGPAVLSGSNYNVVSIAYADGETSCDILKTNTSTLLGTVTKPVASINDTGQSTSAYTAPTYNTTADDFHDGVISYKNISDSSGSPGAATLNVPKGQFAVAASASSVVITDSMVTATTHVAVEIEANDSTCTAKKSVVPTAGSFTLTMNSTCTAATKASFILFH